MPRVTRALILTVSLLTGCTMFRQQSADLTSSNRITTRDLAALSLGEWCRVQLVDEHEGITERYAEHIGLITTVNNELIILKDVTTLRRIDKSLPLLVFGGRIPLSTDVTHEDASIVVVRRSQMARLEKITAERAAELKQPYERIGVDFSWAANGLESRIVESNP